MKKRHYTLQQVGDSLCLTIKGKFLTQEFGLQAGDYFQLISQDNQLILLKTPKEEHSSSTSKAESEEQELAQKLHQRKLARLFPGIART